MDLSHILPALDKLYGANAELQLARYTALENKFREKFGDAELQWFSTPGRTEIGGNHTDHNLGRVLAGSIDLDSIAIAAGSGDDRVCVFSMGYDTCFEINLGELEPNENETGTTTSLIRGIAARLKELGYTIGGFNAYLASDVLPGSGLSSSASIEVLIGKIFSALFNDDNIAPEILAMTGQFAENNFFGKPCGLMDQVACAMGGIVSIDFRDPANPLIKRVNFDFSAQDHSLVVVDTGGNHADLTPDYAAVPAEMKAVAGELGQQVCRMISMEELLESIPEIREKHGDRAVLRAIHFLGENERVLKQVEALENNNFKSFLSLVRDSGNSSFKRLQNIYTPSNVSEQGVSLALTLTEDFLEDLGEGACRVHGGGFAGTIQVFIPNNAVEAYRNLMETVFGTSSVYVLKIRALGSIHLNSMIRKALYI